jgi:type VI secretion system protein ImpA
VNPATPPVLDLAALLDPIPGENPSGPALTYAPVYGEIREARRAEDEIDPDDPWHRPTKAADWDRVVALGASCLAEQTKDLQIAAWMTEALGHLHGFAGLRDGLRLMREIQDRFWETYHPAIDEGDLESRVGPFIFLNTTIPLLIRGVPLTGGAGVQRYSYLRWQESRATENAGLKDPDLKEALVAEGKLTAEQFDTAVAQSPRRFYEALVEDFRQCGDAFQDLDRGTDERFGAAAPGLINVRKALEDCRKLLEPILAAKRRQEPDPAPDVPAAEAAAEERPAVESPEADGYTPPAAGLPPPPSPTPADGGGAPARGPIRDPADAHRRIAEAAAYLRQQDPQSPVPYLVVRALRMGEVYGMARPLDPALLEGPAREVRQDLKRLMAAGRWGDLLEQAEQALARPEGRAWLDPQRYALAAMAAADTDRTAASAAARSLLRAFLADVPELPRAELNDDTPAASAETRAWLQAEILPPPAEPAPVVAEPAPVVAEPAPPPSPPRHRPDPEGSAAEAPPPDPGDEARALVEAGRTAEGLQLLRRAMAAAPTGRERFLRQLQLAEACLRIDRPRVALPLLEDLARQVEQFHLEQWEDEALCARAWGALYQCLRPIAAEDGVAARLQQAYSRLCRLDVGKALALE